MGWRVVEKQLARMAPIYEGTWLRRYLVRKVHSQKENLLGRYPARKLASLKGTQVSPTAVHSLLYRHLVQLNSQVRRYRARKVPIKEGRQLEKLNSQIAMKVPRKVLPSLPTYLAILLGRYLARNGSQLRKQKARKVATKVPSQKGTKLENCIVSEVPNLR